MKRTHHFLKAQNKVYAANPRTIVSGTQDASFNYF